TELERGQRYALVERLRIELARRDKLTETHQLIAAADELLRLIGSDDRGLLDRRRNRHGAVGFWRPGVDRPSSDRCGGDRPGGGYRLRNGGLVGIRLGGGKIEVASDRCGSGGGLDRCSGGRAHADRDLLDRRRKIAGARLERFNRYRELTRDIRGD